MHCIYLFQQKRRRKKTINCSCINLLHFEGSTDLFVPPSYILTPSIIKINAKAYTRTKEKSLNAYCQTSEKGRCPYPSWRGQDMDGDNSIIQLFKFSRYFFTVFICKSIFLVQDRWKSDVNCDKYMCMLCLFHNFCSTVYIWWMHVQKKNHIW